MWSEFEWENKININTPFKEAGQYLYHLMRHTNMSLVGKSFKSIQDQNLFGGSGEAGGSDSKSSTKEESKSTIIAQHRKNSLGSAHGDGDDSDFDLDGASQNLINIRKKWKKLTQKKNANRANVNVVAASSEEDAGTGGGGAGGSPRHSSSKHLTYDEIEAQFDDSVGLRKLIGSSNFIAVNIYSRSIFGEDILANVSIEQIRDSQGNPSKLAGSIRIRSRAQGIALSLGDRVSLVQKQLNAN
jgi:hypothetical protein